MNRPSFTDGHEHQPDDGTVRLDAELSQLGDYQISINVANSQTATVTATFSVDVTQYALPVLLPIPAQTATVGQPFSLAVSQYASDPNASPEPLTYSLGGYFTPAGLTINSSTGLLTWTPSTSELETYTITVNVAESEAAGLTASETFTLKVAEPPPVFGPIPNQTATIGNELEFDVGQYASDPNDSYLTYSLGTAATRRGISQRQWRVYMDPGSDPGDRYDLDHREGFR